MYLYPVADTNWKGYLLLQERPKLDTVNEEVRKSNQMDGRDKNITYKGGQRNSLSQGRHDITEDTWRLQSSSGGETSTDSSSEDDPKNCASSVDSASEDELDNKKPLSYKLPTPPYLKPKSIVTDKGNLDKITDSNDKNLAKNGSNQETHEPVVVQERPKLRPVRRRYKVV